MRNLLFPDFCLFTNRSYYLCEPRAEQVEATEVRTQYIDVALVCCLAMAGASMPDIFRLPCILAESTAVTMAHVM
jgi:hypothetical protein